MDEKERNSWYARKKLICFLVLRIHSIYMTVTKKDITLLKEVFVTKEDLQQYGSQLGSQLRTDLKNDLYQMMTDQFRIFADIFRQELRASEKRTFSAIKESESRILDSMGSFMTTNIVPQLDNHEERITKIEVAHR